MIEKHSIVLVKDYYCYEIEMCVFYKDSYCIKENRFVLGICHYPAYESHMRKYEPISEFSALHELEYAYINKVDEYKSRGFE